MIRLFVALKYACDWGNYFFNLIENESFTKSYVKLTFDLPTKMCFKSSFYYTLKVLIANIIWYFFDALVLMLQTKLVSNRTNR